MLHHAENDFDGFQPDLDTLDERADYVSTAMPVRICNVWTDSSRELTQTSRRKSQVFQLIYIACVILYLDINLGNAALGSGHPRSELIFFNQTFHETVDQPLQRVL